MIIRVVPSTLITQPLSFYEKADLLAIAIVYEYAKTHSLKYHRNYLVGTEEDLTLLKLQLPDNLDASIWKQESRTLTQFNWKTN